MERGCRVLESRAERVAGRTRGRQYTVPTSKGGLAKILSQTRYGGLTAKRGDRGRPGALTLPQAATSGTCDRYRGFCLPPLYLAAPTTQPLSLSYYCQNDVTMPQYPCAAFPYLCLLLPSSCHPANKTMQKRTTRRAVYNCTLSHVDSDNKTVHPSIKHAVRNI